MFQHTNKQTEKFYIFVRPKNGCLPLFQFTFIFKFYRMEQGTHANVYKIYRLHQSFRPYDQKSDLI